MRVLVTGGAGFIGSHLCDALLALDHEVIAFDDFSTGSLENLKSALSHPNFKLIEANILDKEAIEEAVKNSEFVVHLAAAVGVEKILKDPLGSLRTNIHGSENVMFCAAELGTPTIIASTSEIYGKNNSDSLREDSDRILGSPLLSRWTYSEAKAIDEAIARNLFETKDWKVKIVRFFNTVGPRQSPAYGMVIPRFVDAALAGNDLVIHGDGTQSRVFCHIDDAIRGLIALINEDRTWGEAFNVGGVGEITINHLAELVVRKTNSSSSFKYISYETLKLSGFEDMKRRIPNTDKIRDLTGWRPEHNLEKIVSDIVENRKELRDK